MNKDKIKRHVPDSIKPILEDVKKTLQECYGDRLKGIILYGSYARGDFTSGSDIDIVILLEDMEELSTERENYFDAIWKLDLKYDTVISIIPFKEREYRTRRLPIILNARREGIPV